MPRAQKGQRFGGRTKGTPNKATAEKALQAALVASEARKNRRKLGREVLADFMDLHASMAATYQPLPPRLAGDPAALAQARAQGREPDEAKFRYYAKEAVWCAMQLAPYESPRYKAVEVHAPLPGETAPAPQTDRAGKVVDLPTDATVLARHYQSMIAPVKG